MVKYLDVEDLKNGCHLRDILTTQTSFVVGDEDVFEMFREKVNKSQHKQSDKVLQQAIKQLQEDLKNFTISKQMNMFEAKQSFNIKRLI